MKKKIFAAVAAVLVFGMTVCACNGAKLEVNSSEEISAQAVLPADPSGENTNPTTAEIYESILEKIEFPEMYVADDEYILNYYGVDTSKLEDYTFASCIDPTRTDTVILLILKDEADAEEITGSLNLLLQQMGAEMENYNPEANELVKKASVRRNKKYINLIICSDLPAALVVAEGSFQ